MTPSPYQQAVYDFVADADAGNLMVEAVAGSGKTTTIMGALSHMRGDVLLMAFNKSIATELGNRAPSHVMCKTFHSLGFSALVRGRRRGEVEVDGRKTWSILKGKIRGADGARVNLTRPAIDTYGGFVAKLVGLAKQAGIGALAEDSDASAWRAIIRHHNLTLRSRDASEETAIEIARKVLAIAGECDTVIDFDDMLWLALRNNVTFRKFDWVVVDEAQDTNPLQVEIVRRSSDAQTRTVFVGDPMQAIYGFRGADSTAMPRIAETFECTKLPLSVSYRCAANIVATAREYCPHIEAAPNAASGSVTDVEEFDLAKLDGVVLCRNNAPLLAVAYRCIAIGRPVQFHGKDLGKNLDNLIKRIAGATTSLDAFAAKAETWYLREYAKSQNDDDVAAMDRLADRIECLRVMVAAAPEDDRTVQGLRDRAARLFIGRASGLELASIHKSKGMEWDVVNILDAWRMPSKFSVGTPWMEQQESNLHYVAITRAKHVLRYINLPDQD